MWVQQRNTNKPNCWNHTECKNLKVLKLSKLSLVCLLLLQFRLPLFDVCIKMGWGSASASRESTTPFAKQTAVITTLALRPLEIVAMIHWDHWQTRPTATCLILTPSPRRVTADIRNRNSRPATPPPFPHVLPQLGFPLNSCSLSPSLSTSLLTLPHYGAALSLPIN